MSGWWHHPLSLTQWTWVWENSRRLWRTRKPACCSPWSHNESDLTEWLKTTVRRSHTLCLRFDVLTTPSITFKLPLCINAKAPFSSDSPLIKGLSYMFQDKIQCLNYSTPGPTCSSPSLPTTALVPMVQRFPSHQLPQWGSATLSYQFLCTYAVHSAWNIPLPYLPLPFQSPKEIPFSSKKKKEKTNEHLYLLAPPAC